MGASSGLCACIVGEPGDPLSERVAGSLRRRGVRVREARAGGLSALGVTLAGDDFMVGGERIGAVLFRASPGAPFSEGYREADRGFCDVETRAVWVAGLNLPDVLAINRLDAAAWFEDARWPVWRRLLIEAGVPVTACGFGGGGEGDVGERDEEAVWLPFIAPSPRRTPSRATMRLMGAARMRAGLTGGWRRTIVVFGKVLAGPGNGAVAAAVRVLEDAGVVIAEVVSDEATERVAWVEPVPLIREGQACARAGDLVADHIHDHLHRWQS